jgi:FAD/FMN-containing dehydrogenase
MQIKGGGHATNPGFSSTTGIQLYMCRFDQINYNLRTGNVDVGAGCLWDDVYRTLANLETNRGVVGGATMGGVGVAGFLLGGGYSVKTNQYGLGIDNIVKFEVVVPDGRILNVQEDDPEHGDLFVALKVTLLIKRF